jgi:hypothetical protein
VLGSAASTRWQVYEVSGLWRLEPGAGAQGTVTLLHEAPSGAFRASVDSFGRIVFTNQNHLQRDQQSGDPKKGTDGVVLERFWLSFRPGEVRVCASCHGVSDKDHSSASFDQLKHPPAALAELLDHYLSQLRPPSVTRNAVRAPR